VKAHLASLHADFEAEEDLGDLVDVLIETDLTQFKDILAVIDDYLPDALYLEAGDDLQAPLMRQAKARPLKSGPAPLKAR